MSKRVNIIVSGWVQGVFFRYTTRRKAQALNLTGWVKNESDGTVKIVAEGQEEDLQALVKWCYNGIKLAKVEKVDIKWEEATGEFNQFEIKY